MTEDRLQRAGLISGIVYIALQLGAFVYFAAAIFPHFAPIDAPAPERAAAVRALGDTLRLGNYLLVLPSPFFLFFLGGLVSSLRQRLPDAGTIRTSVLAAGTAMALVWPMGAILSDIELDIAVAGGDSVVISSLDAVAPYTLALSAAARAVFVGVLALPLIARAGALRWCGWSGVAIAVLSIAGTATLVAAAAFPVLAASSLLFDVWLLMFCVLWMRPGVLDAGIHPGGRA